MEGNSVKISTSHYNQLKSLCAKTGHKIGFHLDRAINNYLSDEAPVWIQKVAEVVRTRKH